MPMAEIICLTASSTLSSVHSASTSLSSARIVEKETIESTVANKMLRNMGSPPTIFMLAMYHSKLKKTHHAKHILSVVTDSPKVRDSPFSLMSMKKTPRTITQPTSNSTRASWPVWPVSVSHSSSPSTFGNVPPMRKRNAWTAWKETESPMTSFSDSAVSDSHIASCSSTSPSSASATARRTAFVICASSSCAGTEIKIVTSTISGEDRKYDICCKPAQKLIEAKPVMCARSTA
mmetsp:Transcript_39477/g.91649  ORF Transcript_39477/g.91649 Transcript_39477/m.91649 type:complete len:234 (-) Transcript_39477:515-1216(-)